MIEIKTLSNLSQNYTLLLVEDEDALRQSMIHYLSKLFKTVYSASNGEEGLIEFHKHRPDIVLSDIMMPKKNGIEMLKAIKELVPQQECMIFSAFTEITYFVDAINIGVNAYILKPVDYHQLLSALYESCFKINLIQQAQNYQSELEVMVQKRTQELHENYDQTVSALVGLVEQRDTYTAGHSERVALYSQKIALALGHSVEEAKKLYQAGILHDIGKIGTPDAILLKPGYLEGIERKLVEEHVINGYQILHTIPMYSPLAEIIRHHHEHYNGNGYPQGLKGEEIPILARIMTIADAFDAMTSNRIYKAAKTNEEAMAEIRSLAGKQFDPTIVDVACQALEEIASTTVHSQDLPRVIDVERLAYYFKDSLTEAYSVNYLQYLANHSQEWKNYHYGCVVQIHNMGVLNRKEGWNRGDKLLCTVADFLRKEFDTRYIFRILSTNFVILCDRKSSQCSSEFINKEAFIVNNDLEVSVTYYDFDVLGMDVNTLLISIT